MTLTAVAPDWIVCPACGRILGERVGDLALVHHRGARLLALFVGCRGAGCRGGWTSSAGQDLLDRARGLVVRAEPAPSVPSRSP